MSEGPPCSEKREYYRVNFSRVQWKTDIIDHSYQKRTDENGKVLPEDNWVWAPTGVINIHYPEQWGFVFFSEDRAMPAAITRFPRTSTGNGSSANATMPSRSFWIQKEASAMT